MESGGRLLQLIGVLRAVKKGNKGRILKAFDKEAAPILRKFLQSELAAERRGHVRLRIDLEGSPEDVADAGGREEARIETWIRYRLESGNGGPGSGIRIEYGPYLTVPEGEEPRLRLPVAPGEVVEIEMGDGSPFVEELRKRENLLGRGGTPVFRTELEAGAGSGAGDGSAAGSREWELIPNVGEG